MNEAEECYLKSSTLYGLWESDDEDYAEYDPMEAAESRWELQNGR